MTPAPPNTTAMDLPPIGEAGDNAATVVQRILARRTAIINAQAKWVQMAASNRRIYAWGENSDVPDECRQIVNKIQGAVHTQVANHLKEPAKVSIEGVESGEYASWYWCGPPEAAAEVPIQVPAVDPMTGEGLVDEMGQPAVMIQQGLDPLYLGAVLPDGQVQPPVPLPTALVKQLQALAQADLIDPQFICRLNDEYTAKSIQKQFDLDWQEAAADEWMVDICTSNVIEGWQLPLYEFDPNTKQHLLGYNSVDQTYIDQSCTRIRRAVEAGVDLYLDLDEALAMHPEQRDSILAGNPNRGSLVPPSTQGTLPVQYRGQFERMIVRKIVWWLRNQPVGVQAALDGGLVEERMVADEALAQTSAPQASPSEPAPQATRDSNPSDLGDDGIHAQFGGGAAPDEGVPPAPDFANVAQPVRSAFFLAGTDTEVTPGAPGWPLALRQITIIGNELIEDVVCRFPDIPILQIRNTSVVGRPWGIGEPFNTKKLQDAYSGITDDAVQHAKYCAHPAHEMHEGLKQSMEAEYGAAFLNPRQIIGIPAEYWPTNGTANPMIRVVEPPAFPVSSVNIREMIADDFNQIAGRPDVLQGNTPTPTASGKMVANLQAAAVEPLAFKAKEITFLVERLAKLMIYSILHFKTRAEIAQAVSVPEPLMELVLQRAKSRPPNIKVTISTGAGSVIERKRAEVLQWGQMVDPVDGTPYASGQTVRRTIGLDAANEKRNNDSARREIAMLAPQQPGQEEDGGNGGNGGQQKGSESSNGSSNGRFH